MEQTKCAISSGISRSVKLASLESVLNQHLERNRDISHYFSQGKQIPGGSARVLKTLGELFSLRGQLNFQSELLDAPDFCWSNSKMEAYFEQISKNLDVKPRIAIFNKKLDYANQLAEVLKNHLHDQHAIKLEWFIIILIGIEILFEVLHYAERLGWISLEPFTRKSPETQETQGSRVSFSGRSQGSLNEC